MLSTVMLVTIGISQSSVFAQNSTSTPTQNSAPITPAPQPSGGDDDDSSGDDNNNNNDSNDESSNSSGSGNDDGDSDDSDSSSEDEDDFDQTNPLLEQIRNRVYGALSSAGIPVP